VTKIVGRTAELKLLKEALNSGQSELIAVYGRRRIGKTYLIRNCYGKNMVFEVTGLHNGSMTDQLINFSHEINKNTRLKYAFPPKTWFEAFERLEAALDKLKGKKKKVIFIDEFPWIATAKSKFLMAFEHFWNTYCTKRNDLTVVICGSAASYMVQKIIKNKGGLHNRITRKICLLPFTLNETEKFLANRGIKLTRYDIAQLYMALGGVPHYLDKLQKGLSVSQNIDYLCFHKDGMLREEFNQLYASLFDGSDRHIKLIKTLARSNKGLTRNELIKNSGIPSGGDFTQKLDELTESGFVAAYPYYQNKVQLTLYRLSDEYSKFYLKFIESNRNCGEGIWQRLSNSTSYKSWSGFVFETLCLKHIQQIKKALGIDKIYSANYSWFNAEAQIDLLIDRDDHVINLCEMKFHFAPYSLDKAYYLNLKNKVSELRRETGTRKNIFISMISVYGLKENAYSRELINNDLDINTLFCE
jgi:hypothetical protein